MTNLQSPTDPTKFRTKETQTISSLTSQHHNNNLGSEIFFALLTYHHNKGISFQKNIPLSANRLTVNRTRTHYAAYRLENTKQKKYTTEVERAAF